MNRDQACRRIKSILKSLRWGGSGDNVFGRDAVFVSVAPAPETADQIVFPAAFIRPGYGRVDDSRPGLVEQDIVVQITTFVAGDMYGERPLIGANRESKTSHGGRGLLEVETEMLAAIEHLDASGQFGITLQHTSPALAQYDETTGYHTWVEHTFRAFLTTARVHQEPREVSASESGGTVTVSWTAPDDTTNLVGYIVRRASGAIPVAYPDEGTDVAWSAGTSVTDTPGSGAWTYSVFAAYDDLGGSVEHHVSDYDSAFVEF